MLHRAASIAVYLRQPLASVRVEMEFATRQVGKLGLGAQVITHRDRIAENAQVFDFELSAANMEELDALDRSGGTQAALERKWW